MKYLKTFERWGREFIADIREFFSNLKKITYYFKDYYKVDKFFTEISKEIGLKKPMWFFGFTNSTESFYSPIIDQITSKLHIIYPMILKNDYQGIYDWCNDENKSGYNFFEISTKKGIVASIENHISKVIAKDLPTDGNEKGVYKPYYNIKFWNYSIVYSNKREFEELKNIVDEMIKKSDLNDDYNFHVYSTDRIIEITVVHKNKINFTSEQLKEIEEAKEFGQKKYEHLQHLIADKKIIDTGYKYNL
jgi:hypothetical protein